MENLLTVELLSLRIHKSVTSIRSDATRNPKSLPPICRLPGTKRLLWRLIDVEKWIAAHVVINPSDCLSHQPFCETQPKRGRPTKREQFENLHRTRHGRGDTHSDRQV